MTAALEGGEWSAARPGRTLHPGKTRYPFYRRQGGPQGRSGRAKILVATGIRSRTVQPVGSHYTDWATRMCRTVQGSNPGGGEIFRIRPEITLGPPSLLYSVHIKYFHLRCVNIGYIYRASLLLVAPNYCLCIQSNSAVFSFVNTGKQVNLKHARRNFERNLVKDVHHRSVASRNWLKS